MLSKTVAEPHPENNLVPDPASNLRAEMARAGVVSFHRFMELALYCPKTGYYERSRESVGRRGDFVTSVSVGRLFGQFLAAQFASWCEEFSGPVQWVEAGAHDGRLAGNLLGAVRDRHPEVFERISYLILEPSELRRAWQRTTLEAYADRIRWVNSLADLQDEGVIGVIFSNELLDAFPVHRLGWDAGRQRWFEWGVGLDGEQFVWRRMLESTLPCHEALERAGFVLTAELCAVLPDGYMLEVSPEAGEWWRDAAMALRRGRLCTIDYGLLAEQFLSPERRDGTLRSYRRQSVGNDLLATPGEQDLTAHVNFTQLIREGENAGLTTEAFVSQPDFLASIARRVWTDSNPPSATEIRQFQALTHPEHLGRAFRVLVQSRLA